MPVKAQRAILATAFRDFDSPESERMLPEIQNSIRAYYALSQDRQFAEAKNWKEIRLAVEAWKIQLQIDDATGEGYLPADNFSNFALHLAMMYKGETQNGIQGKFNKIYDLVQGTQEGDMFTQPDNTPRTLAQAIKETLDIDYDGQSDSHVLGGNNTASQRGRRRSTGDAAAGERISDGDRAADSAGGTDTESTASSEAVHQSGPERKRPEQNPDGGRQGDGTRVADDATPKILGASDRGDLRVFEEGLDTSYNEYSEYSERTRRTAESERLVGIAKKNRLFIPAEAIKTLTGKRSKRTGESVVYINEKAGKVTKVKNPYAKSAMKIGVQPEDAVFEHLVHNLLFPETAYTLEGISEEMGDVRFVLSQDYIPTYGQPTKEQIAEALAARGLYPEDNYSFGNELVSVTDVEGDNVLLGEDGTVYFIDPIIRFKKPLRDIIDVLSSAERKNVKLNDIRQKGTSSEGGTSSISHTADAVPAISLQSRGDVLQERNVIWRTPKDATTSSAERQGLDYEQPNNAEIATKGSEITPQSISSTDKDTTILPNNNELGENVAVAESDSEHEIKPVGKGVFGNIYDQFKGKPKEAIRFLMQIRSGEALGALHHKDIGEIALIYGNKAAGLCKIVKKHPGVIDDLQGIFNSVKIVEQSDNRIKLESDTHYAVVSRDYLGNPHSPWLLTAFEKKNSALDNTMDTGETSNGSKRNDTTTPQNTVSDNKDTTISPNNNELTEKVTPTPENTSYTIEPAQYTTARGKVLDMYLVKFGNALPKEQHRAAKASAKEEKGWYDVKRGGFMMRSEDSAKRLAESVAGNSDDVSESKPVEIGENSWGKVYQWARVRSLKRQII